MKLIATARRLNPADAIPAGSTEVRPCPGCGQRLAVPTPLLGQAVACPGCKAVDRALPAAVPLPAATPAALAEEPITLGPVMPYRAIDPRDDRSPMVDAVGTLQRLSAAVQLTVAVYHLAAFWKRSDGEDLSPLVAIAVGVVLASLLAAAAAGVRARTWRGWGLALAASLCVLAAAGTLLNDRVHQREGAAGWYDFVILAGLPSTLIAVMTPVLLLTPRYRAEFGRRDQAGTM